MTTPQVVAPRHPPGWLVGQLPVGMREDVMLVKFTTVFEQLGTTLREAADNVEYVADPTLTFPEMLAYLGRWLGYDLLDPKLGAPRQRGIVKALGRALPLRGTRMGLRMILEAVTVGAVRIEDTGGVVDEHGTLSPRGAVVVTVADTGHLREHELRELVRDEVPAHLPVTLVIDPTLRRGPS